MEEWAVTASSIFQNAIIVIFAIESSATFPITNRHYVAISAHVATILLCELDKPVSYAEMALEQQKHKQMRLYSIYNQLKWQIRPDAAMDEEIEIVVSISWINSTGGR